MSHFIIQNANRFNSLGNTPEPKNAKFNETDGFWVTDSNTLLVSEDGFNNLATKKADCETGEDQKGE